MGALAEALGKSTATLRRWERLGFLPQTPLVVRVRGGAPRRVYTTEMIEGLVAIATEERVLARKPATLDGTAFAEKAAALCAQLFPGTPSLRTARDRH